VASRQLYAPKVVYRLDRDPILRGSTLWPDELGDGEAGIAAIAQVGLSHFSDPARMSGVSPHSGLKRTLTRSLHQSRFFEYTP
jgi:hypothetical protein